MNSGGPEDEYNQALYKKRESVLVLSPGMSGRVSWQKCKDVSEIAASCNVKAVGASKSR